MPGFSLKWLIDMGGSSVDIIIFVMGAMFALYVIAMIRLLKEENKALWAKLDKKDSELKLLSERYHRLDSLSYGTAIGVQAIGIAAGFPLKLVNESANGDGDYSLNRSG